MLLDTILEYCDGEYQERSAPCSCFDCNRPSEACSESCEICLEQIHFPSKHINGKKDYDCQNMLNFYACKYLYKYTSEIYHLIAKSSLISSIDNYHILSIGCGASPDLAAFEKYILDTSPKKSISYTGYDVNELWRDIHSVVTDYVNKNQLINKCQFEYVDAIEKLSNNTIKEINVIVMQYIISHLHNTNQVDMINDFFDAIIKNVISHKEKNNPLIVMINDVNSCYKGRDSFQVLAEKLKKAGFNINVEKWYFNNHKITNPAQQYGNPHSGNGIIYRTPQEMSRYSPWKTCSSAQLLIEVK